MAAAAASTEAAAAAAAASAATEFVGVCPMDERMQTALTALPSRISGEALAGITQLRELLAGLDGGKLLHQYVSASPKFTEMVSAWSLGPTADCAVPLMLLISEMMRHPVGKIGLDGSAGEEGEVCAMTKQKAAVAVRLRLDKFARFILSSKIKDVYSHLMSLVRSRQNAALLLISSIVQRGSMLASEVARRFDFTLSALPKLARPSRYPSSQKEKRPKKESILLQSPRLAFIELAMSFLEVSNPALLRWVLQIRPLYAGVLHHLARDEESTILFVLNILHKKVIGVAGMVPPGLQSAVFGDAALEQLATISSSLFLPEASQLAHDTLLLLCTDPSHGIFPPVTSLWRAPTTGRAGSFGGGGGRLLRLMLKLKAIEVEKHRELLMSIAARSPVLVAAYLDCFPYSLEPRVSPAWFKVISVISDLISVVKVPPPFMSLVAEGLPPPSVDSFLVQSILRSFLPRILTRTVINRGLLHVNKLVKHGCLRLLREVLNSAGFNVKAVHAAWRSSLIKGFHYEDASHISSWMQRQQGHPEIYSDVRERDKFETLLDPRFSSHNGIDNFCEAILDEEPLDAHMWLRLGKWIQDEVRACLPDPQVLLSLLTSLGTSQIHDAQVSKCEEIAPSSTYIPCQISTDTINKLSSCDVENPCGFSDAVNDSSNITEESEVILAQLWGEGCNLSSTDDREDVASFFNAKVIEALSAYQSVLPMSFADSSYDVFKMIPEEPLLLSVSEQKSLLSLLMGCTEEASSLYMDCRSYTGRGSLGLGQIYKHLKPLLKIMIGSNVGYVQQQSRCLAYKALLSCGAFEGNCYEARVWIHFLPDWDDAVITFLCDAINSIGKNLYKYLDRLHSVLSSHTLDEGLSNVQFGPFVVCVMEKCFQSLGSGTNKLKFYQKASVSLYVANALNFLLQSQVEPKGLAIVITSLLTCGPHKLHQYKEWKPLEWLLLDAQNVLNSHYTHILHWNSVKRSALRRHNDDHTGCLEKVLQACKGDELSAHTAKLSAMSSCLLGFPVKDIVENFPSVIEVFFQVSHGNFSIIVALFGANRWLMSEIAESWPDIFADAMALASRLSPSKKEAPEVTPCVNVNDNSLEREKDSSSMTILLSSSMQNFSFAAFLLFLPFSVGFPAVASSFQAELLRCKSVSIVLEAALSQVPIEDWISTVNMLLYWICQIGELSKKGLDVEKQLETCFDLVKHLIIPSGEGAWGRVLMQGEKDVTSKLDCVKELIMGVLSHPIFSVHSGIFAVRNSELAHSAFDETRLDRWFLHGRSALLSVHRHVVDILNALLELCCKQQRQNLVWKTEIWSSMKKTILTSCEAFLSGIFNAMKLELSRDASDRIFPSSLLYVAFVFAPYLDLDLLMNLSLMLLSKQSDDCKLESNSHLIGLPCSMVGLQFTTVAFEEIRALSQQSVGYKNVCYWQHWAPKFTSKFNYVLLEDLYQSVVMLMLNKPSKEMAICLLTALEAVSYSLPEQCLFNAGLLQSLILTPVDIVKYFMVNLDEVAARVIFLLIQMGPLYLTEFGRILSCFTSRQNDLSASPFLKLAASLTGIGEMDGLVDIQGLGGDLMLLLPAARHFLAATVKDVTLCRMFAGQVAQVYSPLLTGAIEEWESKMASATREDLIPVIRLIAAKENLSQAMSLTFPGQLSCMLEHYLAQHSLTLNERQRLFRFLFSTDKQFLDSSISSFRLLSLEEMVSAVSSITGRTAVANLLLFSGPVNETLCQDTCEDVVEELTENTGHGQGRCFMKAADCLAFAEKLICTVQVIFQQDRSEFTTEEEIHGHPEISTNQINFCKTRLLEFLEVSLLDGLVHLAQKVDFVSSEGQYITLSKQITKIILRYRFGEILPMKVIHSLAVSLNKKADETGEFTSYALDLLINHSQFISTLVSSEPKLGNDSLFGKINEKEKFSSSLSSILCLVNTPSSQHGMLQCSGGSSTNQVEVDIEIVDSTVKGTDSSDSIVKQKLEILRLLRLLFMLKTQNTGFGTLSVTTVNTRALLSLLLAAYGASLSVVDKEIFSLMRVIESTEGAGCVGLAGMDYVWGESAFKTRQSNSEEQHFAMSSVSVDQESNSELCKRQFQENLLLDPRRCGFTVLFFPSKRDIQIAMSGLAGCEEDVDNNFQQDLQWPCRSNSGERMLMDAPYDPAFILPFSLHTLSTGCIGAEDFVKMGLLAVAFASISSANEGMRKLGYEVLTKYLTVLEGGPSFKGQQQIKLLLIFVKNAITEPWQRLPFLFSLFSAEASCILMNPASVHYSALNKYLLHRPAMDLESIPLFHTMFGSGSVSFHSDHLWMLRFLAFGLLSSQDAHVYRRCFVLEILMSFYNSRLADMHTREWVLQTFERASRIRSLSHYLVEHSGLLSWLASAALSHQPKFGESSSGLCFEIAIQALKVIVNLLSLKSIEHWFCMEGYEELSKVALLFHQFLVNDSRSDRERLNFTRPTLFILMVSFRLSRARKKFETHCSFSFKGLADILKYIELESRSETCVLGLAAILECPPPAATSHEERLLISQLGIWAVSVASQIPYSPSQFLVEIVPGNASNYKFSQKTLRSLMETVLRWLAASVIRGKLPHNLSEKQLATSWTLASSMKTSISDAVPEESGVNNELAKLLINLQNSIGGNGSLLSVVFAVALLMPSIGTYNSKGAMKALSFPQELEELFELLLLEVSCPFEATLSWRWNPSSRSKEKNVHLDENALYELEVCQAFLVVCQRVLLAKGAKQLSCLVETLVLTLSNVDVNYQSSFSSSLISANVYQKLNLLKVKMYRTLCKS